VEPAVNLFEVQASKKWQAKANSMALRWLQWQISPT
jgi:hypothetical protein